MSIPALLLIQVVISLVVVMLYHLWVSRKKPAAPLSPVVLAPVATPPKTPPAVEAAPPEMVAVIAAAIAVVLDRPHQVVSVQQAAVLAPEGNAWAMEGRVEQFLSHRVR
jgi:flagellar basal body-associated protein FliL